MKRIDESTITNIRNDIQSISDTLKSFGDNIDFKIFGKEFEPLLKKVIFLKISDDTDKLSGGANDRDSILNNIALNNLFVSYSIKADVDKDLQFPKDMPIVYYGGFNDNSRAFLEKFKINSENMYNHPDEMEISGSKVEFAKMFPEYDWNPKTVFTIEEAIDGSLKFPVIAKIGNGHSGLGIKIFKDEDELINFKQPFEVNGKEKSFDLYSECIDIDTEYRTIFLKDKCIIINERVACIETNKTVATKDIDESVDFVYVVADMKKVSKEFLERLNDIAKEIREKIKLDVWAIDVAIDKDDNMYVLEINSAPGLGSEKLVEVYCNVYEDWYKEELPESFKEDLNKKIISQCRKELYENFAKEINKSEWAVNYEDIDEKYEYIDYPEFY